MYSLIFLMSALIFANVNERIIWIDSISSSKDLKPEENLKSKLLEFIFGPDEISFSRPVSVVTTSAEFLLVADQKRNELIGINLNKTDPAFKRINDKMAFPSLIDICHGEKDYYFFSDSYLNKIFLIKMKSQQFLPFAQHIDLKQPTGLAFNEKNRQLYVAETGNHRILVLDSSGQIIRIIGERGAKAGQFNYPTHLWLDSRGLLFVVDALNFRVQIFSTDGTFLMMFGEPGNSSGYLARPKGIATDSEGNIYLVDALFHTVQIFNKDGIYLDCFGGQGRTDGRFWLPNGIYIDEDDRIYVADSYNARIQIFQYLHSGTIDEN